MTTKKNLPYIPLYTGDWERDCNTLSLEAEAAWLRIIFKMFTNGKQSTYKISTKSLQNLWRVDENKVFCIIEELIDNNICQITKEENHVIFTSRRYEKENLISEKRKDAVSNRKDRTKSIQNEYKNSTKDIQNTEYENESENVNEDNLEKESPKEKTLKPGRSKGQFIPPSLEDFTKYFIENGFSQELAKRAWTGYQEANWHDSTGKKILNWKQKCQNVWFRPENRLVAGKQNQHEVSKSITSKDAVSKARQLAAEHNKNNLILQKQA